VQIGSDPFIAADGYDDLLRVSSWHWKSVLSDRKPYAVAGLYGQGSGTEAAKRRRR
jgi:hypothetical protein